MTSIGAQSDYASVRPATFAATSGFCGSGSLFQDLATIVRRQKTTDIFNTFLELEKDHLHLSADVDLIKSRNGIDNCEHAIRLCEGHFRYHARYLDLKKNFEELDAAIMLAVPNLSRFCDEFKTTFSSLLFAATAGLASAQAEALMQEAANHGIVFGHWHERGHTLDRSAQIKAGLTRRHRRQQNGLDRAVEGRQRHAGKIRCRHRDGGRIRRRARGGRCTLAGFGLYCGQLDRELLRLGSLLGGEDPADINAVLKDKKDILLKTPTCPLRPMAAKNMCMSNTSGAIFWVDQAFLLTQII
jgi:hypothetical protein